MARTQGAAAATAKPAAEPEKKRIEDLVRERAEQGGDVATVGMPVDLPEDDADEPSPQEAKELPSWAAIPEGVKTPDGWQVWFVRFRARFTNTPGKGDRTCVLWALSEADEKNAAKRARGDGMRVIDECAKQMIRCCDGVRADFTGAAGPGSVAVFWNEIGGKCRHQIKSLYLKLHTMEPQENADFFEHCVAVRTAS